MYANSIAPDEMTRNEPSHQDLHYLPICLMILNNKKTIDNNGHDQKSRRKSSLQKLKAERV